MTLSVPRNMHCVQFAEPGDPDVLVPGQAPVPIARPGEVLIHVAYAGVNRPDVLQRQGKYPPPPDASPLLGLEVAGTVVALGAGVTSLDVGASVCGLAPGGGYAQYCRLPAVHCLPIPQRFSLAQAAALPETFFTVWTNVFERGRLAAGETLLVHGGSSGIGTTAIQLATAFGARVLTTVGSADKVVACLALGAEVAINYRDADFVAEVARLTQGRGVNVILDMVGGDYIPRNVACLAIEGRLVQIAFLQGSKATLDMLPVMLKRLTVTGSTLRPRSIDEKAGIARSLLERVWPLLDTGKVAPVMHAVMPFERASEAHRLMESSQHIGKIVLDFSGLQ